ncbi:CS1 type fimbrial major subunit [Burkholderia sola]|uniref:CS1 type fimbrial major subunit n=1 Tax=Burkholderia sola TaxID=2843302 RepID=UPI0023DDC406|nr:CS1 type fimbrial major subunit [Burkholderia sola]MDF3079890.1 fimbrial protein [Burkholderia sola]
MHQSVIRACLLGATAIAGAAHAAPLKQQELEIKLSAEVPVASSIEIKADGWDLTKRQPIKWGTDQKKFESLTLKVTAKSRVGKLRVKFADAAEPRLVHGDDVEAYFKVDAKIGGKDIGTDPVEVMTKDEAKSGSSIELVITPGEASDKIKAAPVAGKYAGTVPLLFETEVE